MANPLTADFRIEDGNGKAYMLRYSANAWVELEDKLDMGIVAIGQELANWATNPASIRLGTLRAVLWAGLRDHHPEMKLTDCGDLITRMGGVVPALNKISDAIANAFPEAIGATGPQEAAAENPTVRGQNGTGRAS